MGKFKCSTKASRAYKSAKNFGHYKTSFGSKHVRITVGTKGIHTSIKVGPITYKPGSGNYSVKTPINNVKYYGNTKSKSSKSNNSSYEHESHVTSVSSSLMFPFDLILGIFESIIRLLLSLSPIIIIGFIFYLVIFCELYWVLLIPFVIGKRNK